MKTLILVVCFPGSLAFIGGHGIGGVEWFVADDWVKDGSDCENQASQHPQIFVTEVGERPGNRIPSFGLQPPRTVNICIRRPPVWNFRTGKLSVVWTPDREVKIPFNSAEEDDFKENMKEDDFMEKMKEKMSRREDVEYTDMPDMMSPGQEKNEL